MNIREMITRDDCTGCGVCRFICPTKAITMKKDELAEYHPYIERSNCIDCGKCVSACPSVNVEKSVLPVYCYVAFSSYAEDKMHSASGGIASVLSRKVIELGGVVCGVTWDKTMRATHVLVDNTEGLEQFRGSKYVESKLGDVSEILNVLKSGRLLLYIGTPCQVAAIKKNCKRYEENLLTIDLICHGMPPYDYFKEYIQKKSKKITDAKFRGEKDFWLRLYNEDKCVYECFNWYDIYFSAFMGNMIFRRSCYNCKYANPNRIGDLSLGDFWGLGDDAKLSYYNGRKSLVLTNTEKGIRLFESIKTECFFEERSLDEAKKENRQLTKASIPHSDRDIFIHFYPKVGFKKAIMRTSIYKEILRKKYIGIKNAIKQKMLNIWRGLR